MATSERLDGLGARGGRLQQMAEFIRDIRTHESTDVARALVHLNRATVAMVSGADCAGITLVKQDGTIQTLGATHSLPHLLDDLQREFDEGPCLSGSCEQHTVRVDDLYSDRRWLGFRAAAIQYTPVRSILSFQLLDGDTDMAALNLYAERREAFDDAAVELGLVLAAHTSLAWHELRRQQQSRSDRVLRDVIGEAKQILMERYGIDAVAASDLMKRMSRQYDVSLSVIAERLTSNRLGSTTDSRGDSHVSDWQP